MGQVQGEERRGSLYAEVTARVVAELEQGRLPWVQPWDGAACGCTMPENGAIGRRYSGINILILWSAVIERGYSSQRWVTFRQALGLGGNVRRGEKGTTVCYADRFTPRAEEARARDEDRDARQIAFLKRFTVFNVDQCEGLPEELTQTLELPAERETIPQAEALIAATGADFRIGGSHAFYAPDADFVQVPPQQAFREQINFYRTALHELGHWTGHESRLGRDFSGRFGSSAYAREELVAEMASAFTCASLSIQPTVRHADYVGAWLAVLREDERAIFRAASLASKAADYLLAFGAAAEAEAA
jgi:antirestriction protein ArdC